MRKFTVTMSNGAVYSVAAEDSRHAYKIASKVAPLAEVVTVVDNGEFQRQPSEAMPETGEDWLYAGQLMRGVLHRVMRDSRMS